MPQIPGFAYEIEGRNLIINGAFDFFQRDTAINGTGALAANLDTYLGPDRFVLSRNGSSSANDDFQRSTTVPNSEFAYSLSVSRGVALGTDDLSISQRIEARDAKTVAGKTISISFWANIDANVDTMQLILGYPTSSTDDDWSGGTTDFSTTALTSEIDAGSWKLYKVEGVTADALATRGLQFRLRTLNSSGSGDFTNLITGVQINAGSIAIPFRRAGRNIGEELSYCQRYAHKSYDVDTPIGTGSNPNGPIAGIVTGAANPFWSLRFPVKMRTLPTITLYNPNSGASGSWRNNSLGSDVAVTPASVGSDGFRVSVATTANNDVTGHYFVSAEL